jgi:hypothetical protein
VGGLLKAARAASGRAEGLCHVSGAVTCVVTVLAAGGGVARRSNIDRTDASEHALVAAADLEDPEPSQRRARDQSVHRLLRMFGFPILAQRIDHKGT